MSTERSSFGSGFWGTGGVLACLVAIVLGCAGLSCAGLVGLIVLGQGAHQAAPANR